MGKGSEYCWKKLWICIYHYVKYEQNPSYGLDELLKNFNIKLFKSVTLTLRL